VHYHRNFGRRAVSEAKAPLGRLSGGFFVLLSRSCYLLVLRSLGETPFKEGNGHLEIVAPLDQRPRQNRILGVGSVGNPGAPFFGCDVGFDQFNGPNKISQHLTNHSDLSYGNFVRGLKLGLHIHLPAPNV
jgi:hypothetical protein